MEIPLKELSDGKLIDVLTESLDELKTRLENIKSPSAETQPAKKKRRGRPPIKATPIPTRPYKKNPKAKSDPLEGIA